LIRAAVLGHVLGLFLLGLAATMAPPAAIALVDSSDGLKPLIYSLTITAAAGALLAWRNRLPATELSRREGILLVTLIWFAAAAFGGLPFLFSPHFSGFTDAFFEAASGFTTTGATVLPRVEVLDRGLQLWRIQSHWLGGMGIVLLGIAILPLLGVGSMHLYRAEFSGAKSERLKPRIAEAAIALWKIYFALTLAEYVALRLAGMGPFESVCHAFSTLGTGGFSTRTASVGGFENPVVHYIVILFMFLAGVNFARQYQLWVERRPRAFFRDVEVKVYALTIVVATLVVLATLAGEGGYSVERAFRSSLFQVTSIVTTTGFVTEDYEKWKPLPQILLLALMYVGGCTGSSAGGIKISRVVLLLKVVAREFKVMVERRGIFAVKVGGQAVPDASIRSLLNLVYLALLVNFLSCFLLAAMGVDVLTSISAVAASMFNIGPGLGSVGPMENYAHLPAIAKWVLASCMIAGRLEFYTMLVVLTPAFWRK
jgi:trk system potassium uptake protein TrkH